MKAADPVGGDEPAELREELPFERVLPPKLSASATKRRIRCSSPRASAVMFQRYVDLRMDSTGLRSDPRVERRGGAMKKALWVLVVVVAGLGAYAANVLATPSVGQSTTTLGKALAADPVDLSGHSQATRRRLACALTHARDLGLLRDRQQVRQSAGRRAGTRIRGRAWSSWSPARSPTTSATTRAVRRTCTAPGSRSPTRAGPVHMLRNNGTVDAETIAVQFLPKGPTARSTRRIR